MSTTRQARIVGCSAVLLVLQLMVGVTDARADGSRGRCMFTCPSGWVELKPDVHGDRNVWVWHCVQQACPGFCGGDETFAALQEAMEHAIRIGDVETIIRLLRDHRGRFGLNVSRNAAQGYGCTGVGVVSHFTLPSTGRLAAASLARAVEPSTMLLNGRALAERGQVRELGAAISYRLLALPLTPLG